MKITKLDDVQKATHHLYQQSDVAKFKANAKSLISNPLTKILTTPNSLYFKNKLKKFDIVIKAPSIEHSIIMLIEVLRNSDVLSYLDIKYRFEKYLMTSDYDSALACLDESFNIHGFSYWYLESFFGICAIKEEKDKPYELYTGIYDYLSEVEDRDIRLLLEKSNKSVDCDRFLLTIKSIVDTVEKDSIDSDLVRFLFDFSPISEFDVGKILDYTLNLNLPDIYNLTTRCIAYLITNSQFEYQTYFKDLLSISGFEGSNTLEINGLDEKYSEDYFKILSTYLYGEYSETINLIEPVKLKDPSDSKFYDLIVKSHMFNNSKIEVECVLSDFLNSCISHLNFGHELEVANKICQQFMFVDSFQYINLIKQKDNANKTDKNSKKIYFYLYLCLSLKNKHIDSIVFSEFMSEFKTNNIDNVPYFRYKKWLLDEAYSQGSFESYVKSCQEIELFPKHMRDEVFEKLILSNAYLGKFNKVIQLISSSKIDGKFTISKNVLTISNDLVKKNYDVSNVNTLIYLSTLNEHNIIRIKRLSLEIDKHIEKNGFNFVEDLNPSSDELTYIMLNVITIDLIRKQKRKSNSDPLVIRANILRKIKLTKGLASNYELELSELIRQYARQKFLKEIGMGRLLIQRDNIRTVIISSLSEKFDEIKKSIDDNSKIILKLNSNSPEIECHELASDFLLKARDIYTIEDYGIENSLNIHFRHNNIVPELRAPFERAQFICMKLSSNYTDNVYFANLFSMSIKKKIYIEFQTKLRDLSEKIDNYLNAFKNQQLHVYVNNLKDDERLFKYPIKKEDTFNFIAMVNAGTELDDIVEWVLDTFDRKTTLALETGKQFVSSTLCSGLVKIVETFKADIECSFNLETEHFYLKSLDECIADIYMTCNNVSNWFAVTEHHSEDAVITVPIDAALEFVNRTNVHKSIKIKSTELDQTIQIPGIYLVSLLHIFIILFQNAAKCSDDECSIEVNCKSNNGALIFDISNIYSNTDSSKLLEIMEMIKNKRYSIGASKETGSGLYKICRIIHRDIKKGAVIDLELDKITKKFKFIFGITI